MVLPFSAEMIEPFFFFVVFTAQSTLTAFLALVGLLTIIFVEPPTEWWAGGDDISGDWKPTILAIVLMILFFAILFFKPARDLFALRELNGWEIGVAVLAATAWLFLTRWLWRRRAFERYLGIKVGA